MKEKKQIILPTVLREDSWFYEENKEVLEPYLGKPYLSYSSAESWESYREDFIKKRFVGIELPFGIYGAMGTYVGEALEHGEFDKSNPNGFIGQENLDFEKLRPKGAEYEKLIIIPREGYFILGFIDRYEDEGDLGVNILDFKTGGPGKEQKYREDSYTQVILYAHGVELTGKKINKTGVYFIRREGSHVNPPMKIGKEQFYIPLKYNKKRVEFAVKRMDRIASEISSCYSTYLKYFDN